MTLNSLMFGRETAMPVDLLIGLPQDNPQEVTQYAQQLRERMETAHELARRHLRQSAVRQKKTYDAGVKGATFRAGELCWVASKIRKKGVSPKLAPKWRGPGVIIRMYGDVTAEVQLSAQKRVKVHTDMLKSCSSEARPRWMTRALAAVKARQQQETRSGSHPCHVGTQTVSGYQQVDDEGTSADVPADDAPPTTNDDIRDDPVTVDAPAATSAAPATHGQQRRPDNHPPGSRRRSRRFQGSPVSDPEGGCPSTDGTSNPSGLGGRTQAAPCSDGQPCAEVTTSAQDPVPHTRIPGVPDLSGSTAADAQQDSSSRTPAARVPSPTPEPQPSSAAMPDVRDAQHKDPGSGQQRIQWIPMQTGPQLQPMTPLAGYPCPVESRDPWQPSSTTASGPAPWPTYRHFPTGPPPIPMSSVLAPAARIYTAPW